LILQRFGGSKSPGSKPGLFCFREGWRKLTKLKSAERSPLDLRTKKEHCSLYVLITILRESRETDMLRIFVEEAAALTSITLFVGMIAVWAQLFSQF
jgi:hypothetical protein